MICCRYILLLLLTVAYTSCSRHYSITNTTTQYIAITSDLPKDSATLAYIQPYADSLNQKMNKVIGFVETDMSKDKPESSMGNFFCDALLQQSKMYFSAKPDLCIMNYGGLRIPALSKGPITSGKIFELMPFDNFLVLMKIKGDILKEVLNHVAREGGWPVSGVVFKINQNEAADIFINGKPLQTDAQYHLLVSDYMAEGGDKLDVLKGLPYENSGVFVRDALINYIQQQSLQGNTIKAVIDGRIKYAE